MKNIFLWFAFFMIIGCGVAGGVFLLNDTSSAKEDPSKEIAENANTYYRIYFDLNYDNIPINYFDPFFIDPVDSVRLGSSYPAGVSFCSASNIYTTTDVYLQMTSYSGGNMGRVSASGSTHGGSWKVKNSVTYNPSLSTLNLTFTLSGQKYNASGRDVKEIRMKYGCMPSSGNYYVSASLSASYSGSFLSSSIQNFSVTSGNSSVLSPCARTCITGPGINYTMLYNGAKSQTISLPKPVRSGYTFAGWYTSKVGGDLVTDSFFVTSSRTVYARWIAVGGNAELPESTKLTAHKNSGTETLPRQKQISNLTLSYYGYGFKANSSGYLESQNAGVNSSFSMIGIKFTATANASFTINYISYGESNYDYAVFSNLDRALGLSWSEDTDYYKRTYGESSSSVKTLTYSGISSGTHNIYIKYRKDGSQHVGADSLQLWFSNDYFASSSSIPDPYKFHFQGMRYGTLPTLTRTGYTFDGWYTAASGGTRITESSIYTGSDIYPHWTVKSFNVTVIKGDAGISDVTNPATSWNYNGGNVVGGGKQISASYGSSRTISVTTKPGYTFSHWSGDSTSTSSSITCTVNEEKNYTFTAHSKPNTYTVTYNANGGSSPISSTQIAMGDNYGKKNIYDPTLCNLAGPISRSGNIFTVNCNNTSGAWQWGNFFQDYSNSFNLNTKYTVVYECLSFSGTGRFEITLASPDDDPSKTDVSNTGQCLVRVTGVGVYTSSFTTKSSFDLANMVFDLRSYSAFPNGSNVQATFRVSLFVGDITYNSFSYASKGSMPSGNVLPTPTRANYTFDGWYTAASGGTKVLPSTTHTTAGNVTLYAHWTPVSISHKVNLRVISKDGNAVSASNMGGSVSVTRNVISGSTSSASTTTQTTTKATYASHQGQEFKLVASAKAGYVFAGFSTSSTPSASIKQPASPPSTTLSLYPTSGVTYYVYFKQVSGNTLKYDETDKYFYFEDGYYPQSEVSAPSATANGEEFTYNDGTTNITIPVYASGSDRYVKREYDKVV